MIWNFKFTTTPMKQRLLKFTQWVNICGAFNELQNEVITNVMPGEGITVTGKSDNGITISSTGGGGTGLPTGGSQYQVLQRDSGGDAVWDWVRFHS